MGKPYLLKDKPSVWLIGTLAFVLIAMNVIDALATLYWIKIGVEEANPFMAYILQYDTGLFLALKTLGITAASAFLIYCATKRYTLAVYGLVFLVVAYLYPMAVHVFLYTHTSFI